MATIIKASIIAMQQVNNPKGLVRYMADTLLPEHIAAEQFSVCNMLLQCSYEYDYNNKSWWRLCDNDPQAVLPFNNIIAEIPLAYLRGVYYHKDFSFSYKHGDKVELDIFCTDLTIKYRKQDNAPMRTIKEGKPDRILYQIKNAEIEEYKLLNQKHRFDIPRQRGVLPAILIAA